MRRLLYISSLTIITCALAAPNLLAYPRSSSCNSCHGDFDGPTSPKDPPTVFPSGDKHAMHNGSQQMNTDCGLCHDSIGDDPLLENCAGCHVGAGLRAHHAANGVTCYGTCHSPQTSAPENVSPPYYGSSGTNVDNPCNDVLAAKTGENWSIGDFLGLDNDGDNLYDQADYDCEPAARIVAIAIEGNDARVTWETMGGRPEVLRSASAVDGIYGDVGSSIESAVVGPVTTNRLEVGGANASAMRSYQVKSVP